MDFQKLLQVADRKHQEAAKQSQQIKRINTHFTTPAAKDHKSTSRPRSEAVQKLIDEKKREERKKQEAEEKERRRKKKKREEEEREEKRKNTFRIPKKAAPQDPPSDAESFSSISSGDEAKLSSNAQASLSARHGGEVSEHSGSKKSHKSSHDHHKSSRHTDGEKSHHASSVEQTERKERHSSSHSSKHRSHEHSSSGKDHHRSETDSSKRHSDKHKHSSEKHHSSGSSKDKSNSSSSSHSKTSHFKPSNSQHLEIKDKHIVLEDKAFVVAENNSSGYVTSPDISSDEEEEPSTPTAKQPSAKVGASLKTSKQHTGSSSNQQHSSSDKKKESGDVPVELVRHHLKPTKDRVGGSLEERAKMLEKLQAIRERMADNDVPGRKRVVAKGEERKRRARRGVDGDYSGSCREMIAYDEEEKPSLKRPEPKPEEKKEKKAKENKEKKPRVEKVKDKHRIGSERSSGSKGEGKFNRFDAMKEKTDRPKIKPRPRPQAPVINFADLMKLAEQKQVEPVMVDVAPKKEKDRRPMTQEEIDRKLAREERLKTKEYKDWYKYGSKAIAKQNRTEDESHSGGFLRQNHEVVPPNSGAGVSKPFSIPRKSDSSAKNNKPSSSAVATNGPLTSSAGHPAVSKSHGTVSSKPHSVNSEHRSQPPRPAGEEKKMAPSSSGQSASQSRPHTSSAAAVDKTRGGNVWDSLFSRPEYAKGKASSAPMKRKRVIDSEDEDEYDEEMDDFIDDEGEEDPNDVSSMIQKMFNYDKRKYRHLDDDDDRNMEVGFDQVEREEKRSARLGMQEDLEDIRREQEELRQKAMKKKMRK